MYTCQGFGKNFSRNFAFARIKKVIYMHLNKKAPRWGLLLQLYFLDLIDKCLTIGLKKFHHIKHFV